MTDSGSRRRRADAGRGRRSKRRTHLNRLAPGDGDRVVDEQFGEQAIVVRRRDQIAEKVADGIGEIHLRGAVCATECLPQPRRIFATGRTGICFTWWAAPTVLRADQAST